MSYEIMKYDAIMNYDSEVERLHFLSPLPRFRFGI